MAESRYGQRWMGKVTIGTMIDDSSTCYPAVGAFEWNSMVFAFRDLKVVMNK